MGLGIWVPALFVWCAENICFCGVGSGETSELADKGSCRVGPVRWAGGVGLIKGFFLMGQKGGKF